MKIPIRVAGTEDAPEVAVLVKALTDEISERCGVRHFELDMVELTARCADYIERGVYAVLVARSRAHEAVGFVALCECHALYAGGSFGVVQECYVVPQWREQGLGSRLMEEAATLARSRDWVRLELCTPPLPQFERALAFYRRCGFEITGGRKMKQLLAAQWGS